MGWKTRHGVGWKIHKEYIFREMRGKVSQFDVIRTLSCRCESILSSHASIINTQRIVQIANYGFASTIHPQTTVYYDFRVNKKSFLDCERHGLRITWKEIEKSDCSMSMIFNFPLIGYNFLPRVGGVETEGKMNEK